MKPKASVFLDACWLFVEGVGVESQPVSVAEGSGEATVLKTSLQGFPGEVCVGTEC